MTEFMFLSKRMREQKTFLILGGHSKKFAMCKPERQEGDLCQETNLVTLWPQIAWSLEYDKQIFNF